MLSHDAAQQRLTVEANATLGTKKEAAALRLQLSMQRDAIAQVRCSLRCVCLISCCLLIIYILLFAHLFLFSAQIDRRAQGGRGRRRCGRHRIDGAREPARTHRVRFSARRVHAPQEVARHDDYAHGSIEAAREGGGGRALGDRAGVRRASPPPSLLEAHPSSTPPRASCFRSAESHAFFFLPLFPSLSLRP